jgi:Dolichyl-phosphate-mannose-protein mannosyltransferase
MPRRVVRVSTAVRPADKPDSHALDDAARTRAQGRSAAARAWLTGLVGRPSRRVPVSAALAIAIPALAAFTVGLWRISVPSYWRDESVTLAMARRPLGDMVHALDRSDAVHGLYYLLMHPIAAIGTSETIMRLPSVVAAAAAAAGIAALGVRLGSVRAGLLGGLTYAALPVVSRYAQEARSYALVSAIAVAATYLLVRALDQERAQWRLYLGYAAAVAALGWLHLYALLLVAAHGLTVLAWPANRRAYRPWLVAVIAAGAAVVPLGLAARSQEGQVAWLRRPDLSSLPTLGTFIAGSAAAVAVLLLLVAAGVAWSGRRGASVVLPWLLVPPALSLAISQLHPIYVPRYLMYIVPALALGAGFGIEQIAKWVGRGRFRVAAIAAAIVPLALICALALPTQLSIREPDSRPDNLRAFAAVLRSGSLPGDRVLFVPADRQDFVTAYPAAFAGLDTRSLQAADGTDLPTASLAARIDRAPRVWVIQSRPPNGAYRSPYAAANLAALRADRRFTRVGVWTFGHTKLLLFDRDDKYGAPGGA